MKHKIDEKLLKTLNTTKNFHLILKTMGTRRLLQPLTVHVKNNVQEPMPLASRSLLDFYLNLATSSSLLTCPSMFALKSVWSILSTQFSDPNKLMCQVRGEAATFRAILAMFPARLTCGMY